ncbi:MAG TPA: hypothetical protein VFX33_13665 [Actinomycetales bacterium]|nr:hypothetical protein [Actinomycetales bacterium]
MVSGLWSGESFSHHTDHYSFDDVQFLPPPLQQPRIAVWVSAMTRNERTLGRAGRWDGVLLGAMSADGGWTSCRRRRWRRWRHVTMRPWTSSSMRGWNRAGDVRGHGCDVGAHYRLA